VGDDDRVLETAEKKRISPWATAGLYHFARGRDFYDAVEEAVRLDQTTAGEFYVAPLYNALIHRGAKIYADYAAWVRPMGTPEDLRASVAGGLKVPPQG
jgi:dTDP-glucose pyrophosphorylase